MDQSREHFRKILQTTFPKIGNEFADVVYDLCCMREKKGQQYGNNKDTYINCVANLPVYFGHIDPSGYAMMLTSKQDLAYWNDNREENKEEYIIDGIVWRIIALIMLRREQGS